MTRKNTIPIVVGVTGHRMIREQDREALLQSVKGELDKLKARCPSSELVMLNSLAEGGDLLCADAAEALGIPLIAPLPMPVAQYETDFSEVGIVRLRHHLSRAAQMFVAPFTEAEPAGGAARGFRYRQAGIYVADHCHILLALWDGGPGTDAACGTAEAVGFALDGSYDPAAGVALRSGHNETVIHIFTPRGSRTDEAAGTVHVLDEDEALSDILGKTDRFNRLAADTELGKKTRLPDTGSEDPCLERMEKVSLTAGKLSSRYAKQYRRVLALLAFAGSLLAFAFLMYDEAHVFWMILVCGVMLLSAWLCQRFAVRSDCHCRYIEYRALAECTRVQTYLRYAGSNIRMSELLSWTQQTETPWIMDALFALEIGKPSAATHDIRMCWVEEQRSYHAQAAKRSQGKLGASKRIVRIATILSIGLYVAAVIFELLCGNLFFPPVVQIADMACYRMILGILLGTISAITLLTAGYYGRLSLPRTLSDHQKMERFYTKMSDLLEKQGQSEKILRVLAQEELIENGNWSSYQQDNKPELNL